MFNFSPLLTLAQSHEGALTDVTSRLQSNGLKVVRSFDLQSACAAYPGALCPHHGEEVCDCQLVVLLIYGDAAHPVSLIAHSNDGLTQFGLGQFPDEDPNAHLESRICDALYQPHRDVPRRKAAYASKH